MRNLIFLTVVVASGCATTNPDLLDIQNQRGLENAATVTAEDLVEAYYKAGGFDYRIQQIVDKIVYPMIPDLEHRLGREFSEEERNEVWWTVHVALYRRFEELAPDRVYGPMAESTLRELSGTTIHKAHEFLSTHEGQMLLEAVVDWEYDFFQFIGTELIGTGISAARQMYEPQEEGLSESAEDEEPAFGFSVSSDPVGDNHPKSFVAKIYQDENGMFSVEGMQRSFDEIQLLDFYSALDPGPILTTSDMDTFGGHCAAMIAGLVDRPAFKKAEDGWEQVKLVEVWPDIDGIRSMVLGICNSSPFPRSVRD